MRKKYIAHIIDFYPFIQRYVCQLVIQILIHIISNECTIFQLEVLEVYTCSKYHLVTTHNCKKSYIAHNIYFIPFLKRHFFQFVIQISIHQFVKFYYLSIITE